MPKNTYTYVAIDIAKDSLQVQSPVQASRLDYTDEGLRILVDLVKQQINPLVVFEATGGYERPLIEMLTKQSIPVHLSNPRRIRGFAISEGVRAKTDPIDAALILAFAREKELKPNQDASPSQRELTALMDRRTQLTEQLAREKNRRAKATDQVRPWIDTMIEQINAQIKEIDQAIEAVIQKSERLHAQDISLQSVCGVGKVTSWTLLAYLSEINQLGRNQIVALAGLAPFNRDSGKKEGKRFIQGGRSKVRRALFMAAKTASQHNPVIKTYVDRLINEKKKPYKSALTAAMRKLLIHIQSNLQKLNYELA